MKLQTSKKVHYDSGPNMTPMVDVVMVILIFLMLAGSFVGSEHYLVSNIPFSQSEAGETKVPPGFIPDEPLDIRVDSPTSDQFIATAGQIRTGDEKVLTAAYQNAAEHEQGRKIGRSNPGQNRPGKKVKYRFLVQVYEAALNAGFKKLRLRPAIESEIGLSAQDQLENLFRRLRLRDPVDVRILLRVTRHRAAGLDSLTDDRVMADLANRGLSSLLDRAFDVNQVSPDAATPCDRSCSSASSTIRTPLFRRRSARQSRAGRRGNPPRAPESHRSPRAHAAGHRPARRRRRTRRQYPQILGRKPPNQAECRPVVEAVIRLLDKAAAQAKEQADAIANTITRPEIPAESRGKARRARHLRRLHAPHGRLLPLPRTRQSRSARKDIATKAIDFLHQYDNADSTVQPTIRLRIAKLHMMCDEFAQAQDIFATLSATPAKDISPPPDPAQQWEAHYFSAVCDLLVGTLPQAQKSLDAVIAWQTQNLPKDKATQDGAAAATSMLQYRLDALLASTGATDDIKTKANANAIAVLVDLVKGRPIFRRSSFSSSCPRCRPMPI